MDKLKEYKRICDKLGFVPSKYKHDYAGTEFDGAVNPFAVLTTDEIMFLYENGYFFTNKFLF